MSLNPSAPSSSVSHDLSQPQPISVEAPLPHRRDIRQWLVPLSKRVTLKPILMMVLDYALFFLCLYGVVVLQSPMLKVLCGLLAGFVIGRLFIIGHDACHQSLTPHRSLNKVLGRIAFLASLTPYSLWDKGHNLVHHGYTNLKGVDFVWEPLTPQAYEQLGGFGKFWYRLCRSGWFPGLYFLVEIWWKREFFPSKTYMPTRRTVFLLDSLLSAVFALLWLAALWYVAHLTKQAVWELWLCGFATPFLLWHFMIGFVVYVHHTHTKISWHADKTDWSQSQPFVSTTVHLIFPLQWGALMHHIMEHTAHHVDMSIPLYRLKEAQAKLEQLLPKRIVIQKFSWKWYFQTARACKLYDYSRRTWLDFKGRAPAAATATATC